MRQSMLNDQTLGVSELFQLGFLVCFFVGDFSCNNH